MVNEDLNELYILQKLSLQTEISFNAYLITLYIMFGE